MSGRLRVKTIYLAAMSADMILLDRMSGLGRSAREIEDLMRKLGNASAAVHRLRKQNGK